MTQLRWTKRRSGQRMITLRVEHHLDRTEVVNALAQGHKYDDDLPDLTQAQALDDVRETLRRYGFEVPGYWTDHVPDSEQERIEEWANGIADRLGAPRRDTP